MSSKQESLLFAGLGDKYYSEVDTLPLSKSFLIHKNNNLQDRLQLSVSDEEFLKLASGEVRFRDVEPIASIYAGHQFGHFVPQLGDGRSCLIGQTNGYELSLKGAGTTPYSRGADGRAVLRSSIREYLCSVAMKGLKIATTEALSLVGSSTEVYREKIETGAIILRTAPSHIRFGHFELFASRGQTTQIKILADFVIDNYYCHINGDARYIDFFNEVVKRTAIMIAGWQAQGFSHGVMNTDNMSILGLTIDYGPFGFLETYKPNFVCNHSDYEGRYAFDRQPAIALWNLTRLAESLSSLINTKQATMVLDKYQDYLVTNYSMLMRKKFGLIGSDEKDKDLINSFFNILSQHKKDYTNSIRLLSRPDDLSKDTDFSDWLDTYSKRASQENGDNMEQEMNRVNPKYILRNYLAEVAIRNAEDEKDYNEIEALFNLLSNPFDEHEGLEYYANTAPDWAKGLEVSCSS